MPTLTFQGGPFDGERLKVDVGTLNCLVESVRGMKSTGFTVVEPYVFYAESGKGKQVKVQVHGVTRAKRSAVYRMPTYSSGQLFPFNRRLQFVGWE